MTTQEADICLTSCVHTETVEQARKAMLPQEVIVDLAGLFKILGDPTRVQILRALTLCELCVCDLAALLCMTSSAVSHQLRLLRTAKLVKFRKAGKIVFYSLDDDHVAGLMREGLDHVSHG